MSSIVLVLPPLIGAALLVLVLAVLAGRLGAQRTGTHPGALAARWAGILAAGALLGVVLALTGRGIPATGRLAYGGLLSITPCLVAALLILAVILGEQTMPAPRARHRYGLLAHRSVSTMVPRLPLAAVLGVLLVLLVHGIWATAVASGCADGRCLERSGVDAEGNLVTSVSSPFPGAWYTVPTALALAVLLLLAALAIAVIVRRRPSDDPADALLRRRCATSVMGAVLLALGMTLVGHAGAAGLRIDGPESVIPWTGAVIGLVSLPWGAVMLVFPGLVVRGTATPAGRVRTADPAQARR